MKWPAPLLCRARLAALPGHRRNNESNSICQKETSRSPTNSHLSNQEDATKRQQCASVHLLRVSRRDASSICGEKSAAIRFVKDMEVFSLPNIDSAREGCENPIVGFGGFDGP